MIAKLTGILSESDSNYVTIDVSGVGYAVATTEAWKSKNVLGTTVTCHIYTHVKEDSFELYGFETKQEKYIFTLLISVSGVGPKTALLIVNNGVGNVEQAIANADVGFFTGIPRIGQKNAQKIIIELKNKIGSVTELDLQSGNNPMQQDIVEALTSMGFPRQEIIQVVAKHINPEESLSVNIKHILKLYAK